MRPAWLRGNALGVVAAVGSALAYGVTVVIGRHLAHAGVTSATALTLRFGGSALLMLALLAATGRPLMPPPGERLRVILLGSIGYGTESTIFYASLAHGSAAAIDLVFYGYPALVCLGELALGTMRWSKRVAGALVLTTGGVAIVTLTGGSVNIEPIGIGLALGAATAFTIYLLAGQRLVRNTDPVVNAAWVAFGCALFMLGRGVVTGTLTAPHHVSWLLIVAYAAANLFAFVLLFLALERIGATRTALLLTMEVLATIVLGAVFLHEHLTAGQFVGAVPVLAGAALVAGARHAKKPGEDVRIEETMAEVEPP